MDVYVSLLIKTIFVENLVLSFFLGMCTLLAVSKKVETALGLGAAVIVCQAGADAESGRIGARASVSNHLLQRKTQDL